MASPATMPATAGDRGRIAPAKLAHFVLRSADADRLVDWYTTVLEAEVVFGNDVLTFLTYDDEHHRLAVVADPDAAPRQGPSTGLEHVAFTYAGLDELVATYERLRDRGIIPAWCVNHGMTLSMYYADPDGNHVELQIDLCTPAEAAAFMASDVFAANPVGIAFDPDDLARRHGAGESAASLTAYGA